MRSALIRQQQTGSHDVSKTDDVIMNMDAVSMTSFRSSEFSSTSSEQAELLVWRHFTAAAAEISFQIRGFFYRGLRVTSHCDEDLLRWRHEKKSRKFFSGNFVTFQDFQGFQKLSIFKNFILFVSIFKNFIYFHFFLFFFQPKIIFPVVSMSVILLLE